MIRILRYTTLGVALLAGATEAAAQTSKAPGEDVPIGCLYAARRFETAAYQEAQAANKPFDGKGIHAQAIERVRQCGAKFDVDHLDPAQRPGLGLLYMAIGDVPRARTILATAERTLPAGDSAKATALLQVMQAYGGDADPAAALADSKRIVRRIDSIPGVLEQKLAAHGALISWANNADLDTLSRDNVAAVIALIPSLTPAQQSANAQILIEAYSTRAVHQANALHPDSALSTLAEAQRVLSGIPEISKAFATDIKRYSMIGKAAPALHADYWINAPAHALKGTATVLVFTANWCHSCKTSYPSIIKAMSTYSSSRLQTVFAVHLDGRFHGKSMTPAQEVDANREYFATEHGFKNPIAVQRATNGEMAPPDSASNAEAYAMSYLPQVVVIDQQGIVRAFLQGWYETGNRAHSFQMALSNVIEKK
jgi:thiol-disulfide isomerase/thioredoxin